MSPDISGNYSVDHARSVYLCEQAFLAADKLLCSGGNFVCKVFSGGDLPELLNMLKNSFRMIKQYSPPARRLFH